MKYLKIAAAVAVAAAAGLGNSVSLAQTAAPPSIRTKIVSSGNCLITAPSGDIGGVAFLPMIGAIVLPVLIELGIDAVSAELKKVRTVTSSGSMELDLYDLLPLAERREPSDRYPQLRFPGCITILTGEFADNESVQLSRVQSSNPVGPAATEDQLLARLQANGIAIAPGELHLAVEVKILPSNDRTAYRYEPQFIRVLKLLPGNSRRAQGLVLNLSLRGPGAEPNGSIYSMAPLDLGTVSAGHELHVNSSDAVVQRKLREMRSGYLVMPGMGDSAYRAYLRDVTTGEDTRQSYMPAVLRADLVQTQKPSDAAVFVAGLLDKSKTKLVENAGALITGLDPFTASQAKLDAEIGVATAESELAEAKATNNSEKMTLANLKLAKAREKLAELTD